MKKKQTPLGKRLQWTALMLSTLFLAVQAAVTYWTYQAAAAQSAEQWTNETLKYAQRSVDSGVQEMLLLTGQLIENERLKALAEDYFRYEALTYQSIDAERSLGNLMHTLILGYEGVANAAVTFSGRTFHSMRTSRAPVMDANLMDAITSLEAASVQIVESQGISYVVFAGRMTLKSGGNAIITLTMKDGWLGELAGGYEHIVIRDGKAVIHAPFGILEAAADHPREYRVIESVSEATGWSFALYTKASEISSPLAQIGWMLLMGLLASALLAAKLSKWLVRRVMEPVELLSHSIEESSKTHTPVPLVFRSRRKRLTDAVMTYLMVTCMLPICLYGVWYYGASAAVMKTTMTNTAVRHAEQAAHTGEEFMDRANRLSVMLATDPNVQETLWNHRNGEEPAVSQIHEFLAAVHQWEAIMQEEITVTVFNGQGISVLSTIGRKQAMDLAILGYYQDTNDPFAYYALEDGSLTLYRRIRSTLEGRSSLKLLGYLQLKIKNGLELAPGEDVITGAMMSLVKEEDLDAQFDQSLAAPATANGGGTQLYEEDGQLLIHAPMGGKKYSVLCRVDAGLLQESAAALLPVECMVVLAVLLVIQFIAHALSGRFTRSIEIMQYNLLNWYGNETVMDLSTGIEDSELATIAKTFNTMDARIKQLVQDAYQRKLYEMQKENDLKEAELMALQAQIHPHFLYNTLESMKYMVLERRIDTAVEMIEMLGDLYHAAAAERTGLVALKEELEYARAYAELQRIRFEDALSVDFEIPKEAEDVLVPKLSLQPLIENAISHGAVNGHKLHVKVWAQIDAQVMRVTVLNDGRTISREALEKVQSRLLHSGYTGEGIGLVNVHRRIRLYFGDEYGTTIRNIAQEGVEVVMTVPGRSFE